MPLPGFEPGTHSLKGYRANHYAIEADKINLRSWWESNSWLLNLQFNSRPSWPRSLNMDLTGLEPVEFRF